MTPKNYDITKVYLHIFVIYNQQIRPYKFKIRK